LLLGLVAAVDYIASTRYVLEFSPFYVVPVAFFTWFVGKHAAVGLGLVCAAIGLAARLHSIPRLSVYWDGLVWFGLYLAAILVLSELKKLYERERKLERNDFGEVVLLYGRADLEADLTLGATHKFALNQLPFLSSKESAHAVDTARHSTMTTPQFILNFVMTSPRQRPACFHIFM
jgi:hypothetical protein